ncbi:MAG: AI-2E family transporter [Lachnospiraceae bacterium]|nr:AI-2E family transporter [Lachnospiraceae bacterium]
MELNKKNTQKILLIITFTIVLLVGLFNISSVIAGVKGILSILSPFILGGCIAFILNSPMRCIERNLFGRRKDGKKSKFARPLSIVLTILFVLGIVFIVLFIIVPELGNTFAILGNNIAAFVPKVEGWATDLSKKYPEIQSYVGDLELDWARISSEAVTFVKNFMNGFLSSTVGFLNSTIGVVSSIVSGITRFLIGFVFSIYVLARKENLGRQGKQILYATLKEKRAERIIGILALSERTFSNFLSGQCVEAVILGAMFFVAMTILRFPYALLVGVLIAFTALIPIFGAFVGCVVATFLILMVNPIQALWFIVLFNVLQQIEGNLIYPHVVGGSVGLPSIWVLFAVTVGGNLMGVVGMLVFIPLCSVIYTIIRSLVYKGLEQRNIPQHKWLIPVDIKDLATKEGTVHPKSSTPSASSDSDTKNILTKLPKKKD